MPEVSALPINLPVGTFSPLSDTEVASADRHGSIIGIPWLGQRFQELKQTGAVRSQYWSAPAAASTTGCHAAVTDNGAQQTVTTGLVQPDYARNVTATAGGTAGDIKAIQVIVYGTDRDDNPISETLPAFTVDTAGTVTGSKAFKTVTSVVIPAHDGTGATTAIGYGAKLGLDRTLQRGNTVLQANVDGVKEATAPTVAFDAANLCSNTVTTNTAPNGSRNIEVFWIDAVPRAA